jgi:hypothetical protein
VSKGGVLITRQYRAGQIPHWRCPDLRVQAAAAFLMPALPACSLFVHLACDIPSVTRAQSRINTGACGD